jgi:hypothetical protein
MSLYSYRMLQYCSLLSFMHNPPAMVDHGRETEETRARMADGCGRPASHAQHAVLLVKMLVLVCLMDLESRAPSTPFVGVRL